MPVPGHLRQPGLGLYLPWWQSAGMATVLQRPCSVLAAVADTGSGGREACTWELGARHVCESAIQTLRWPGIQVVHPDVRQELCCLHVERVCKLPGLLQDLEQRGCLR